MRGRHADAATLALSASPASASGSYSSRAYVYGAGVFTDDWNDEGKLSTSDNTSSNATCLWQKILWADGSIEADGTTFDAADIDGIFGENTKTATKNWQTSEGLTSDGVVKKEDFADAEQWGLLDVNDDGAVDTYNGGRYGISVTRDSEGRYNFYDGDGIKRLAGYDYRTCS
jgi:peptidoglycan hydrolase-like protein with peptidoglycan-binding domain